MAAALPRLGITTCATLVLELSLTRIFSVVFYYHFAFLAISIALFGLGAGGVFSYVVAARRGNLYAKLGTLSLVNSIVVVGSLWVILSRTGDPGNATIAAVYLVSALPFFLAGAIVSLAVAEAIQRIDRAYFFDLAGRGCRLPRADPVAQRLRRTEHRDRGRCAVCRRAAIWFHQPDPNAAAPARCWCRSCW